MNFLSHVRNTIVSIRNLSNVSVRLHDLHRALYPSLRLQT